MPSGVRDIQLLELKDTISQLNNTISTQNELIRSLQKMLQERDAKDSEKDQLIANLQAQLDYLKAKLFGSTSEIRHEQLPGQLDLFHLQTEDEPEPVPLEVEYIEVKAHKKARKSKAAYDEVFADLPTENVYVDQKPVIEAFLSWLDHLHPESGDRLINAINYSNGCRPFMMNYLKDGACSLSNNLSENSIRPLVVGRKNWLFCDTPAGADASMKIYSMIETAKANELDPLKYLSFLLEHRPSAEMSDEELEQFAPWSELTQKTCK